MRLLDISNINCWLVNLKLLNNNLLDFQIKCIKKNLFGIGWSYENHYNLSGERFLINNVNKYIEEFNSYAKINKWNFYISKTAINNICYIKKGDIVMTRLHNGHYYIGRVSKEAFFNNKIFDTVDDNKIMSWVCEVENWYECKTDFDIPTEISGRFSQKHQSTITRIAQYRAKLLSISLYEKISNKIIINVPKIQITVDNFSRSLNYTDLENLVCRYIYDKHNYEKYMLLPSSGKTSRMKYEFEFVNDDDLPITCQVKNQNAKPINVSDYIDDIDQYKIIYLFSGNDNINNDVNNEKIKTISHNELFNTLFNFKYLHYKLLMYYTFNHKSYFNDVLTKLKEKDWKQCSKYNKNLKSFKVSSTNDKIHDNKTKWIAIGYDGFFFSNDFNCFIILWKNDMTEKLKELIKQYFNIE